MLIELAFNPVVWYIWIPVLILIGLLIYFRKKYKKLTWIFISFFIFFLLQPGTSNISPDTTKRDKIYLDTSYSMMGVNSAELDLVLKQLASNLNFYSYFDLNEKNIKQKIINYNHKKKKLASLMEKNFQSDKTESHSIVITDVKNSKSPFQILLKGKPPKIAVFNLTLPSSCFIGEACIFKLKVLSKTANTLLIKTKKKVLKQVEIRSEKPKDISVELFFGKNWSVQSLPIQIEFIKKDNRYPDLAKWQVFLSLRKGQPQGLFFYDKLSIKSWRLSYELAQNPYVKVKTFMQKKQKINWYNAKTQFGVRLQKNIPLSIPKFKYIEKVLYIIYGSGGRKSLLEKLNFKQQGKYWVKNNIWIMQYYFPISNNNVFFNTNQFKVVFENFLKELASSIPGFLTQSVEYNKKLFLEDVTNKSYFIKLLAILDDSLMEIQKNFDYVENRPFYFLPYDSAYKVYESKKSFTLNPSIQKEERLAMLDQYFTNEKNFDSYHSKDVLSVITKWKNNIKKVSNELPMKKNFYLLGFIGNEKISQLNFILFFVLFLTIMLLFWYLPLEKY